MKKYQQLAQQITEQIGLGVWLPGDRLPSLREQVVSSGMSFMTVSHAYQLLESQGRIIARPQSGYYVAPQPIKQRQPEPPAQVTRDESVDINTYIFRGAAGQPSGVHAALCLRFSRSAPVSAAAA
ncbi:GntR family transcriptional regulator [Klebsiella michiganensis]|nr:GntR family transcriptional regulator [Klebsiella michiganensis]